MWVIFTTESGTRYKIDKDAMTWEKLSVTQRSGKTRGNSGQLRSWPAVAMGQRVALDDSDVLPGHHTHVVLTSQVRAIEEGDR